ncbi:protein of unknown function [Clostridium sp. USBA 49]|uniref:DUF4250 domain-containing protein n=1 Tax=Clostridium TaxID=1485 RepID=UPI00099B1C98|nr:MULTISPECIES: DUF4250 domain-containing protein [Clostridium]SKA78668.1 protein of unknown function [Clostridium sp. USBA 49]
MDREEMLKMDSYMLLSIVNMKLRDEFYSLSSFCENYGIKEEEIINKLSTIGYVYNVDNNQFIYK